MLPKFNLITLVFLCLVFPFLNFSFAKGAYSCPPAQVSNFKISDRSLLFEENKGQLTDQKGDILQDIKYYGRSNGVYFYCKPGIISFVFTKNENSAPAISEASLKNVLDITVQNPEQLPGKKAGNITKAGMDMVLKYSNPNPIIIASEQQDYYENFYTGGDANIGITNVHTYKTITYKNIYPAIDMILHIGAKGLEYSFLVHPGGNPADINLRWNGTHKTEFLKNGGIIHHNALGSLSETEPISYNAGKKVASSFLQNKNGSLGFKIGKWNHSQDLLIDPLLLWSTFFGGSANEEVFGICTDPAGNVALTGRTQSTKGIATSGTYQTTLGGNYDILLVKFSTSGSLAWATYFGGSDDDEAFKLSADGSGNFLVVGIAASTSGMATSGAYQTSNGGGAHDAILAKFSGSGALTWATYLGGSGNELGECVGIDGSGNAYISGFSASSGLATSGAYQTSLGGGTYDAFLAKFTSSGNLSFFTYFGGSGLDYGGNIYLDASSNIFLSGATNSSSNIATSGALQTSFGGGNNDGFLAKFTSSGNLSWATYYGGAKDDFVLGMSADPSGNMYLAGYTNSTSGIATSGAYQTSMGGGNYDAFLAKISPSGGLTWATYYGGSGFAYAIGTATDAFSNTYIVGYTTSTSNIATSGAYQTAGAGNEDVFLARFNSAGYLVYGTYYGGGGSDFGRSIVTDANSNVFITGYTTSSSGIATSGAYQSTNAGNDDVFLAKFLFKTYQVDAGIDSLKSPSKAFCTGSQTVKVEMRNFGVKTLTATQVNWSINDTLQTPYSWTGSLSSGNGTSVTLGTYSFHPGTAKFKAWTSKPNGTIDSLPDNDTFRLNLTVNPLPSVITGGSQTICDGGSASLGAPGTTGYTYSWTSNPAGYTSNDPNPGLSPTSTTIYKLKVVINATGCINTDSAKVTVNPVPIAHPGSPKTICQGDSVTIGAAATAGHTYNWATNPKSGYGATSSSPVVKPLSTTVYVVAETIKATGCYSTDSVKITVNPLPIPATGADQNICLGNSLKIGKTAISGHSYSWTSNPSGFTATTDIINISPTATTTIYLKETITATGCTKSDSVKISVNPLPKPAAGVSQTICHGGQAPIGMKADTNYLYKWTSTPAGYTATTANATLIPTTTTWYKLKEIIKLTGCSYTDSVQITVNPLPVIVFGSARAVCSGSAINIGSTALNGNSYSWTSNPAGFTSTLSNPSVSPSLNTIYQLKETIIATGCSKTDSIAIQVNPLPIPKVGSAQAICLGNSAIVGNAPDSGYSYNWTSNPKGFNSTSSNPVVKPTQTTRYLLKQTNLFTGCSANDSISISINPLPDARWILNYHGNTTYFHALDSSLADSTYHWYFGDNDSATKHATTHTYTKNKTYLVKLKITNTNGCTNEKDSSVSITVSGIRASALNNNANLSLNIYPNPFRNSELISYNLDKKTNIKIAIFDISGKQIAILTNECQLPGPYQLEINADKYHLIQGVYLLKLNLDDAYLSRYIIKL